MKRSKHCKKDFTQVYPYALYIHTYIIYILYIYTYIYVVYIILYIGYIYIILCACSTGTLFDEFSGLDLSVETVKIIYYKVIFKVGAPLHVPSLAALHCIILHFFLPTNRLRVVRGLQF